MAKRRRKAKPDPRQLNGVLVLNKPSGPTSTDCLNDIKHQCGQPTIGHAGTLDPLAAGVLVVLLGQATKLAPYLSGAQKTYTGALRLGLSTDTYDIQGQTTAEADAETLAAITPEQASRAVAQWNDITEQEVPAYSAAKHQGKPLYELARAGEQTPVKIKAVSISGAEALMVALPEVTFKVTCSAGTYVRSLVHSLGQRLGTGATMTALTREVSHPFTLAQAHNLDDVLAAPDNLSDRVLDIPQALPHWPKLSLDTASEAKVKNGMRLPAQGALLPETCSPGDRALFLDGRGMPVALVEATDDGQGLCWAVLRGLWGGNG